MSLVKDTVANFIGGVSQQPEKLMYPNQSKALVNYHPSPSIGLKDRPPTEHIARLTDSMDVHPLCHTIIKEDEEYEVIFTGDGIKVFDLEGNEKTVTIADDDCLSYITTDDPLKDLYAVTIADYTFVLNRTVETALTDDTFENPYPASGLIFVRQGNYTTDHIIYIDGDEEASYTSTSDLSTTKTNYIAKQLYNDLVSNLGTTNWTITRSGSIIVLTNKNGDSFSMLAEDSNADEDLYAWTTEADSVELLPTVAPNGYILKIRGEDVNTADDYYVQFETTDGEDIGSGSWKECCCPDIQYHIDPATMPHALIRQSDGTFSFETIDWADRGAGDEDSAPTPSFIGNTIQDVFTHKGRLAFLSVDRSIYSDTQDIFSFFKKSTLAELDTDPIDVFSNSKMVLLRHEMPFNEELLLFSETSAFSIKGGDVFSNSTVAIDLTMEYPCSRYVKPINAGGTGFFLFENGDYSRVMEVYITSVYTVDARDVTEQIPSYLPKNMYKMAGSTANSIVAFLSTDETDNMYIYNYYYSSEQKVQSAWSKWTFENTKILNADFHDNWLYMVMQYDDGIYLEKMNFTPKNKEPDLDYLFYLDRKVYFEEDDLTVDEDENTTTFTLPYTPYNTITVLNAAGFPLDYEIDDTTVTVKGQRDYLCVGNTFTSIWEMPSIYYRQQSQNGTKVIEGVLMLRDINLCYADTGYFKITVEPDFTTNITSEFEFTGKKAGMISSTIGQINISSDTFLLPVIARNEEVTITVTNDSYLPSCFLSLEWIGELTIRGK